MGYEAQRLPATSRSMSVRWKVSSSVSHDVTLLDITNEHEPNRQLFERLRPSAVSRWAGVEIEARGVLDSGRWAWQAPQLAFVAYHVLLMALFFGSTGSSAVERFEWILALVGSVVIAVQLITGLGYFGTFVEEIYFLALLWMLFIASFNVALVILRQVSVEPSPCASVR